MNSSKPSSPSTKNLYTRMGHRPIPRTQRNNVHKAPHSEKLSFKNVLDIIDDLSKNTHAHPRSRTQTAEPVATHKERFEKKNSTPRFKKDYFSLEGMKGSVHSDAGMRGVDKVTDNPRLKEKNLRSKQMMTKRKFPKGTIEFDDFGVGDEGSEAVDFIERFSRAPSSSSSTPWDAPDTLDSYGKRLSHFADALSPSSTSNTYQQSIKKGGDRTMSNNFSDFSDTDELTATLKSVEPLDAFEATSEEEGEESLLSSRNKESIMHSLSSLGSAIDPHQDHDDEGGARDSTSSVGTLDTLVHDILAREIGRWVNANLAFLVEKIVREEIQAIVEKKSS